MNTLAPRSGPILEILTLLSPDSSKRTLRSWLDWGRIEVDGEIVKLAKTPVEKGQRICLQAKVMQAPEGVDILHEDHYVIVIEKPEGLLTVAAPYEENLSAHNILKRRNKTKQRIYPVHRLDREASGILVFAIGEDSREALKAQFQKHTCERTYFALVEGNVRESSGTWQSHLFEDANYHVKSVKEGGKLAITHYSVVKRTKNSTLLCVKLETGRKNQIRVHCADAGHPIVGDAKYGSVKPGRLHLHAKELCFIHPETGNKMCFKSKRKFP
ncbi:MAG: RluA family pseudouridine synthase [Simkaniaceae bacterium]|nr:RluA family pseudouridine synthase [Simkaniaceae bacterium]